MPMGVSTRGRPDGARWWNVVAALAVLVVASLATGCGVAYPNCNGDNDCRSHHEVCVNRHCQQCRATSDCPAHHTCLRNRCVEGDNACDQDSDCPNGHCVNHRCAATQCDQHHACPGGAPCVNGQCGAPNASTEPPDPVDNQGRLCTFQPVYFAFDNSSLDDAARRALQSAADCLQREHNSRYVLIGHADPRGTTEYNLALGERRARTAQTYLQSLGVEGPRVQVSSEGSEGATGTDEASWARDRRVDFRPRD